MVDGIRARRLRAPLLMVVWALLAIEAVGGLVIFVARLATGALPGETLHVVAGVALTAIYAVYQWHHWKRVRPARAQLHYALGLIAALFMLSCNVTGLWLAAYWWHDRWIVPSEGAVRYPALLSGVHNVMSMVVLTFVGAHLGAVLVRDRQHQP